MTDNDTVKEAPYCITCRYSSAVKWRNHVFSRGHQNTAKNFLQLQVNRLQTLCNHETSDSFNHWRCVFCDVAMATVDAVLTHWSSNVHRQRVENFCRHYRCDVDRKMRSQLWLQPAQRRKLEMLLRTSPVEDQVEQQETHVQVKNGTNERVEAFLSSATSRLQEVHEKRWKAVERMAGVKMILKTNERQDTSLLGPHLALARCCKTITSLEGVMQNPLGRHEGKRVWGGGIVRLRKNEWIPWAIDQLVKEEQAGHDQPDKQQTGTEGTAFTHRVTEVAQGEGLSSVTPVSWVACVGNVHTAAVPPWMVQTEEEYKKCNQRKQAAPSLAVAIGLTSKADKKKRDIYSELQSKSECDQDWLPNFGGVWQEGPRSKTKQAFRKAANAAKPSRNCDQAQQSKFSLSQSSAANSQESQLPPAVQDSVLERKQEAPSLSPSERKDNESKIGNPLDGKKQLLLAQKERLRAKMAAKRRQ